MSRGNNTITWGYALIAAAFFLAVTQSLAWALAAAGVVAVIGGLIANTIESARTANGQAEEEPLRHDLPLTQYENERATVLAAAADKPTEAGLG
jgi:hypothetical protein